MVKTRFLKFFWAPFPLDGCVIYEVTNRLMDLAADNKDCVFISTTDPRKRRERRVERRK
mgnify:CR=1 FL=1